MAIYSVWQLPQSGMVMFWSHGRVPKENGLYLWSKEKHLLLSWQANRAVVPCLFAATLGGRSRRNQKAGDCDVQWHHCACVQRFTVYITTSSMVPVSDSGPRRTATFFLLVSLFFVSDMYRTCAARGGRGFTSEQRQFYVGVELAVAQWVGLCRLQYCFCRGAGCTPLFLVRVMGYNNHKHAQSYNLRRTSSSPGRASGLGTGVQRSGVFFLCL